MAHVSALCLVPFISVINLFKPGDIKEIIMHKIRHSPDDEISCAGYLYRIHELHNSRSNVTKQKTHYRYSRPKANA